MNKVYEIVTQKVLSMLAEGVIPWRKPWTGGTQALPMNFRSKKPYRGINVFLLWSMGYECPYWLTIKQVNEMGGKVLKGEKATLVVFWKTGTYKPEVDEGAGEEVEEKKSFLLRYYNVFNLAQTTLADKWEKPKGTKHDETGMAAAEAVVTGYADAPEIQHGKEQAYYSPTKDIIGMPSKARFGKIEEYYSTLFHEMAHSTGHKDRLDRKFEEATGGFGSDDYSKEELVAEFCSTFLCGVAGIENRTIKNSAAYIEHWTKRLKDEPMLVVCAAARAQKAADYILGTHAETTENN